jgi:hypothetical protein
MDDKDSHNKDRHNSNTHHTIDITFCQQNLQRCRNATDHLLSNASEYDILLLQEPYVGATGVLTAPKNFKIYQTTGSSDNPCKAVIATTNSKLKVTFRNDISDTHHAFVTLASEKSTLIIGSIYISPSATLSQTTDKIVQLASTGTEVIIGGDVNAKSHWWGSSKNDKRGEELSSCLASCGWDIINEGHTPTYNTWRGQTHITSFIDITVSTPKTTDKIINWTVQPQHNPISDHEPIIFTYTEMSQPYTNSESTYKYIINENTNWTEVEDAFRFHMTELNINLRSIHSANHPHELDIITDNMTAAIKNACNQSLPQRTQHSTRKRPIWWTNQLTEIKRATLTAKRKLQNASHITRLEKLNTYITQRDTYKRSIDEAKIKSIKTFYGNQTSQTAWSSLHKTIKITNPRDPPTTLSTNGHQHITARDSAEALTKKFFPDDDPNSDTQTQSMTRNSSEHILPNTEDDPQFTLHEIKTIVHNMSSKKAPGHDHLTADICTHFINTFPEEIHALYNQCLNISHFPTTWKHAIIKPIPKPAKDTKDTNSYRPIGLLPVFGKVLEKLLIQRTFWHLTQNKEISNINTASHHRHRQNTRYTRPSTQSKVT